MNSTLKSTVPFEVVNGLRISDIDVVDFDDFIPAGDYNPHNIHPFILHDHGFVLAVVFASHLQDALDIAVDADKLDRYLVTADELREDYDADEEGIARLGNAGEPFDIEGLSVEELENPAMSFTALLKAARDEKLKSIEAERCGRCKQPKAHAFHAPSGIFGSELKTHDFEPEVK